MGLLWYMGPMEAISHRNDDEMKYEMKSQDNNHCPSLWESSLVKSFST